MTKLPVDTGPGRHSASSRSTRTRWRAGSSSWRSARRPDWCPTLGGPRVYRMADLLRGYLRARGKHRITVPVPLPGKAARAFRAGANLAPDRAVGRRTWEDFLAERVSPSGNGSSVPA